MKSVKQGVRCDDDTTIMNADEHSRIVQSVPNSIVGSIMGGSLFRCFCLGNH